MSTVNGRELDEWAPDTEIHDVNTDVTEMPLRAPAEPIDDEVTKPYRFKPVRIVVRQEWTEP